MGDGGRRREAREGGEAGIEVLAGEAPVEGDGGVVVQRLEGQQPALDGGQVREGVRGEDLALDDGEVDLDLVEPRRMDGQVHQDEGRVLRPEPLAGGLAAMAAAVIHDPEDPWRGAIRLLRYDLVDQPPEWADAGGRLAAPDDPTAPDIPGGQDWLSGAQAVLRPRALEGSVYGMWLRPWLALSAYASGDLETARATAAEIVRIGRGGGSRWDESIGEWLQGVLAHGQGRHDEARAHLEASRALSADPRLPFPLGRSLLGLSELAKKEDENIGKAWELAHDGLEVLDDYGDRVGAAAALEAIADLAVALGEPERSLRLLAASQRFHTDTGIARFPVQADRFDRARSTARAGLDLTHATACWDAGCALSLADAVAYARRGRGERQRPQIGWASLTPVERDVVRLVAEGHTNAEIGQRLFMSVNTVKKHLSHVYAKVEVDGRADLAAQVARRDL